MALVNPLSFIQKAREKGVAIAAFNVHNLETIQAVAEGAAEERAPLSPNHTRHLKTCRVSINTCVKVLQACPSTLP